MFLTLIAVFGFLFPGGEEKELQKLHTTAITSLHNKDYTAAKKAYEEILEIIEPPFAHTDKYEVDVATYVDIILRYSEACLFLKEFEEGKKYLLNLSQAPIPSVLLPQIEIQLSRYEMALGLPDEAFLRLKKIQQEIPLEKWKGEDLSFFHSVEITLNDKYDALKNRAKRFFASQSYQEAAQMLEMVLHAIEKGTYPHAEEGVLDKRLRYLLAETYFHQKNLDGAKTLLLGEKEQSADAVFLLARVFKEKKSYEQAISEFKRYLEMGENSLFYEEALFEIGFGYYSCNDFSSAKHYLEKVEINQERPSLLASLFLAKIYLEEDMERAEKILNQLDQNMDLADPLRAELLFLQGKVLFLQNAFEKAIPLFERAIQCHPTGSEEIACYLGESYSKTARYQEAETLFQNLLKYTKEEKILLALGRVFLLKGEREKGEQFLLAQFGHFSTNGKLETLLTLSTFKSSYEEKKELLLSATAPLFETSRLYPKSWYLRGLNELNVSHWQEAVECFEKAFSSVDPDSIQGKKMRALQATTLFLGEDVASAYHILEKLMPSTQEEILYLYGQIALSYGKESEGVTALQSLQPSSRFKNDAAYLLGCHFYTQKKYEEAYASFLKVENSGDALFWAAMAIEKMCGDQKEALLLRKKCFQNFPKCPLAPLAYFKLYTLENYMEGTQEAMAGLLEFPNLFPHSPYLTPVYFFLGENATDPAMASVYYQKAIASFLPGHKEALLFFRYRSILELAALTFDSEAEALLEGMEKELSGVSSYPFLLQECHFLQTQIFIQQNNVEKGKEALLKIVLRFKEAGMLESYYLSKAWIELGKIALSMKDVEQATLCFETAETTAGASLLPDELFSLFILESDCYRQQGDTEHAMKLLSKVINDDIVSPLQLKAMYLRAEIYEQEHRYELAIRQLEATAKKGGEWGEKAKQKLKGNYGIE